MKLIISSKNRKPLIVAFRTKERRDMHTFILPDGSTGADLAEVILESVRVPHQYQYWSHLPEAMEAVRAGIKLNHPTSFFCGEIEVSLC